MKNFEPQKLEIELISSLITCSVTIIPTANSSAKTDNWNRLINRQFVLQFGWKSTDSNNESPIWNECEKNKKFLLNQTQIFELLQRSVEKSKQKTHANELFREIGCLSSQQLLLTWTKKNNKFS